MLIIIIINLNNKTLCFLCFTVIGVSLFSLKRYLFDGTILTKLFVFSFFMLTKFVFTRKVRKNKHIYFPTFWINKNIFSVWKRILKKKESYFDSHAIEINFNPGKHCLRCSKVIMQSHQIFGPYQLYFMINYQKEPIERIWQPI